MANVDLSIINAALTRTGNNPITSLTDNAIGATIAAANYETMVRAELASNPWKIAKKIAVLDLAVKEVDDVFLPHSRSERAQQRARQASQPLGRLKQVPKLRRLPFRA